MRLFARWIEHALDVAFNALMTPMRARTSLDRHVLQPAKAPASRPAIRHHVLPWADHFRCWHFSDMPQ
jgi:hypothetical protein